MIAYFVNLFEISLHVYLPMLIIDVLKWPIAALNGVLFLSAIFAVIPIIVLSFVRISDPHIFTLSVIGVFAYAIVQLIFIILKVYNEHLVLNILLMIVECILQANATLVEEVFVGVFFSENGLLKVPSSCR